MLALCDRDPRPLARAISLTGSQAGIVTDTVHGQAKIVDIRASPHPRGAGRREDRARRRLPGRLDRLRHHDARPRRLGHNRRRAGGALGAEACEIYTDVDGVHTADPRVVAKARSCTPSATTVLELVAGGAKVLQLRSVELARGHDVKLHVRSSFSDASGTWIREEDERMLEKALISGVTHTIEERVYRVEDISAAMLFQALAEAGINVDTVVQTGSEIVFSAADAEGTEADAALEKSRRFLVGT